MWLGVWGGLEGILGVFSRSGLSPLFFSGFRVGGSLGWWSFRCVVICGLSGREPVVGRKPCPGGARLGGALAAAMAGLSQEEKIASLQPDFQGLLDARGVDATMQAALFDAGVPSIAMLSAVATDRDSLLEVARSELGVDIGARPRDAIKFAALYLSWQSAVKRRVAMDELDADATAHKQPKSVPKVEMQLYRAEFEKRFFRLKDAECPGKPSFEDVCEQLDNGEFRPMALRHFGSRMEEDDAETGSLHLGKAGQVKIKKARVETANPANMEEFRAKVNLMINHLIFARFRYPHKASLDELTPFTAIEYLNYICSKNVAQLESLVVDDVALHRPSLKLIMSYEVQMRKEAVEQVNKGDTWVVALKSVVKNADIRERYFSTPLPVTSAMQSIKEDSWNRQRKWQERQHPYAEQQKGKIKSKTKGKKGAKGKSKGKGSQQLYASTPDGRQLCFAWNNKAEGCAGSCGRVHACRVCLDPGHPMHEHVNDNKDS